MGPTRLKCVHRAHLLLVFAAIVALIAWAPQCTASSTSLGDTSATGDELNSIDGVSLEDGGAAAPTFNIHDERQNPLLKVYNTTVYWHGGSSGHVSCTNCTSVAPGASFLAPDFACNMQDFPYPAQPGDWSNGTKEFFLGVDPSRIVTQVNLTMHGRFRCPPMSQHGQNDLPPTILNILVESAAVTQEPLDYPACLECPFCNTCDSCMTTVKVTGTQFETWPTLWNYYTNNTINVRVLSGLVCLYAIEIYAETVPAHLPVTTIITTSNTSTTSDSSTTASTSTSTGGGGSGGSDDKKFKMPYWGYILIGVCTLSCCVSMVVWTSYVAAKRRRRRRYGSIQDDLEGKQCCCFGSSAVNTDAESDYGSDYDYTRSPPTIYTSIDVNEVGDDTRRLLGIATENGAMGSAERKALLKISHRKRGSDQHRKEQRHHRRKKSQDGLVKQMDYGEIVLGERVGKGSYGEVFKGTWRGTEVAVKKLPYYFEQLEDKEQQKTFLEGFIQETQLMKTLRHPNVIQLYASFTHPEVMIVMEFMAKGSLYQILHDKSIDLSWDLRRQILLDAARGMTYLHKSQPVIVHRDLKSHNLLVGEHWRCKVSDFGLSRMLTAMDTMTSCGTPSWTAPEVLRGEKYTEKCDVYSFGIVLWECVTRMSPHEGIPHFQVVFQVGTQGLRPELPTDTPHAWARLTTECWAEDPDARPSFEEILDRLQKF